MSVSSSGVEAPAIRPVPAALALVHGAWIWWMSDRTIAGGSGPLWRFLSDGTHFVLFGVLAVLLAETCRRDGTWSRTALLAVLALTVAYGVADELHQASTPGRVPDGGDVCVDFLGAIGALSLWWGVRGPGRLPPALGRAGAVGLAAIAFIAARTFGPLS